MLSNLGFDHYSAIVICMVVWCITLLLIVGACRSRRYGSVGVPIAYAMLLTIIHAGAAIYLLPWYDPQSDAYLRSQGANLETVSFGLQVSTVGCVSLLIGLYLADSLFTVFPSVSDVRVANPIRFGRWIIFFGAMFFFIIFPLANKIPSGAAIASAGVQLSIVGICLIAYASLKSSFTVKMQAIASTLSLPAITMLLMGFVGYGIGAVIEISSFVTRFVRARWWAIPVMAFTFWIALSFYVTYMANRSEMRAKVWENAPMLERVALFYEKTKEAQFFDPFNVKHLYQIDNRINQNILVGRCIEHIHSGRSDFAYGESLKIAAIAWIPRIIWPNKPTFGGSTNFASIYTGQQFQQSTSVGVGLVMEMYANFGYSGVIIGFCLVGMFIRYFDRRAAINLKAGQYWDYVIFHLIGISAIQPGGFLAEAVASSAAALVLGVGLKRLLIRQRLFLERPSQAPGPGRMLGARPR